MAHAAATPAVEICGLLFGSGDRIAEARRCRNVASQPHDSFELDPVDLIAAHRAERAGGATVIGHYHSHPYGPAVPSARDAAMAEEGSFWLLIAGGQARLWRAVRGGVVEAMFDPLDLCLLADDDRDAGCGIDR